MKNLVELQLRKRYGINVVAIRDGDDVQIDIDPQRKLTKEMSLIVMASTSKLSKIK